MTAQRTFHLCGCCLSFLILAPQLEGQDLESPKQFYQQGYVNQPPQQKPEPSPTPWTNAAPVGTLSETASAGDSQTPDPTPEVAETPIVGAEPAAAEFAVGEGEVPSAVSILLSTSDAENLLKQYGELLELSQRTGLRLKDLFLVGDPAALPTTGVFSKLGEAPKGIVTRFVSKVPKEFGEVKNSPTLLIETKAGLVVVEGYSSIRKFFTKEGRFIEPGQSPRATPASSP